MKKTIFIVFLALVMLSFSVSAWHCTDTDAKVVPTWSNTNHYGTWGDNGFLNGTTLGWGETDTAPAGCTGTQGNYVCPDRCDGTTLVEYYCGDRQPTQVCDKWNYDSNHHKTTCKTYTTENHWGETIIFSKEYKNSDQCIPETPEFGVVAGSLALVGALGIFLYRRKD